MWFGVFLSVIKEWIINISCYKCRIRNWLLILMEKMFSSAVSRTHINNLHSWSDADFEC